MKLPYMQARVARARIQGAAWKCRPVIPFWACVAKPLHACSDFSYLCECKRNRCWPMFKMNQDHTAYINYNNVLLVYTHKQTLIQPFFNWGVQNRLYKNRTGAPNYCFGMIYKSREFHKYRKSDIIKCVRWNQYTTSKWIKLQQI